MKKKLLVYEKEKIEEFICKVESEKGKVFPVSYLMDKNVNLKYNGINDEECFVLDITALVMSLSERKGLQLIYESWINALNEENEDCIEYCVEREYLFQACELFHYYFETDEVDVKKDVEEKTVIEEKSIVEYAKREFDDLMDNFEIQLYGHERFKKNLKNQLKAYILLYRMKRKKIFSILLCGKSGIGKTEVGRILQKAMYPKEPPIKINFGNYSGKGSLWSLIGSPKGYMGSETGGELTNKITNSKSKIIVIDELDKADATIFNFFYEMLEDGQYTDLVGKVVDLDGYIVIFTANLDSSNFQEMIPEPLFSRFDMTYEFQQLTTEDKKRFVSEFIDVLIAEYEENIGQLNSKNIKDELMKNSYHTYTNVRLIKRDVMNAFVDLVDVNNIWNDYTE